MNIVFVWSSTKGSLNTMPPYVDILSIRRLEDPINDVTHCSRDKFQMIMPRWMHGILVVKGFCWELQHIQILNVKMCLRFRPNGSSSVLTPISYIDEGKRYSRVSVREGLWIVLFERRREWPGISSSKSGGMRGVDKGQSQGRRYFAAPSTGNCIDEWYASWLQRDNEGWACVRLRLIQSSWFGGVRGLPASETHVATYI